jgi:hypothetical protein
MSLVVIGIAIVSAVTIFLLISRRGRANARRQDDNQAANRKRRRIVTEEDIREHMPPAELPARSGSMPTCVVCLSAIEVGQEAITTQCGHLFHADCIVQWWTYRRLRTIRCPTCRKKQKVRRQRHTFNGHIEDEVAEEGAVDPAVAAEEGAANPPPVGPDTPAPAPPAGDPGLVAQEASPVEEI